MAKRRWPKGTWMKVTSKDTLKALIKQRGYSYAELGEAAGCHKTMISALVNGYRTSCTSDLGERIAKVLGVPSELIFVASPSADSGRSDKRKAKDAA